ARTARFLALTVDHGTVLVAVLLDEMHLAAELARDRAHLDPDLAQYVVAFAPGQLRTWHQWDDLFEVGEDVPGVLDRGADGELVRNLHSVIPLSSSCTVRARR